MFCFGVDKRTFVLYNIFEEKHTFVLRVLTYIMSKSLTIYLIGGITMIKRRSSNSMRSFIYKFVIMILSLIIILLMGLYFNSDNVSADNPTNRNKQVVSIRIEKGDTLWDIAKEYMTEEYNDINEYIKEIKLSNGLYTDTIHEGRYLIVPYFVEASNNIRTSRLD